MPTVSITSSNQLSTPTFTLTRAPKKTEPERGESGEATRESFIAWLQWQVPPRTTPKGDLPLFNLARFKDNYRDSAHLDAVFAYAFDVDQRHITAEEIQTGLESLGLSGVFFPSSSSTPTASRWRLFVWPSRPMTLNDYNRTWPLVRESLPFKDATTANVKSPVQGSYAPREPAEGDFKVHVVERGEVDLDALLKVAPELPETSGTGADIPEGDWMEKHVRPERWEQAVKVLGTNWPAKGRHWSQRALAGGLIRAGFSEAGAVKFLREVCALAGDEDPVKRGATVRDTIACVQAGRPYDGWPKLKDHVPGEVVDEASWLLGGPLAMSDEEKASWMRKFYLRNWPVAANDESPPTPIADTPIAEGDALVLKWRTIIAEVMSFSAQSRKLRTPRKLDWAKEPAPIPFSVSGVLVKGSVNLFYAPGGSSKSYILLSLALAVAKGTSWLGKYPTTKGKVVYLDYEMNEATCIRRGHHLGIPSLDDGFTYLEGEGNLLDPYTWAELEAATPEFLVIDSLSMGSGGLEENSKEAATPLRIAKRFAALTGCTVVVIHHGGKGNRSDTEMARGHGSIRDAVDEAWCCDKVEEVELPSKRIRVELRPNKRRLFWAGDIHFELGVNGATSYDLKDVQPEPKGEETEEALLAKLLPSIDSVLGLPGGKTAVQSRLKVSTTKAGKVVDLGCARGELVVIHSGKAITIHRDDCEKRKARVFAQIKKDPSVAASMLADRAHVRAEMVAEMVAQNLIGQTSKLGNWFIVESD